jgi:hypothetical protein
VQQIKRYNNNNSILLTAIGLSHGGSGHLTHILSALPNIGPYIYDVKIYGFTRSSIYI